MPPTTEHLPAADPTMAAAPCPSPERPGWARRAGRAVGRAALKAAEVATPPAVAAAAITTPLAWGMVAVLEQGPAPVPTTIAGLHVTVEANIGHDAINIEALDSGLHHHTPIPPIAGKTIGATVTFDASNAQLEDKKGNIDVAKLKSVAGEFSSTDKVTQIFRDAVISHSELALATGLAGSLVVESGAAMVYVRRRRQLRRITDPVEQDAVRRDRRDSRVVGAITLGAFAAAPLAFLSYTYVSPNQHDPIAIDHYLDRVAGGGWGVTGLAKPAIDNGLPSLQDMMNQKKAFYTALGRSQQDQFHAAFGPAGLAKDENASRFIVFDDPQGQDGAAAVIAQAAALSDAEGIIIGGDMTATGSGLETAVFDNLRRYAGNRPIVLAGGQHDTNITFKLAQQRGFIVSDGRVHYVGGIPFYPVRDADVIDSVGAKPHLLHAGVTEEDVARQTIGKVCGKESAPIVVVHDKAIGRAVAETNCAPDVVDGRVFVQPSPVSFGRTDELTFGSGGGHRNPDGLDVYSVLANDATYRIVDIDRTTHSIVDYVDATLSPFPAPHASFSRVHYASEIPLAPVARNYNAAATVPAWPTARYR